MSSSRVDPLRGTRIKMVIIGIALAVVLTVFEIAVRQVRPDAVRYDVQEATNGTVVFSKTGTITNPATVAQWHMAVTRQPSGKFLWQLGGNCAPLTTTSADYVFLWHGVPIETVSSLPSCGDFFMVTRGFLPDLHLYTIDPLLQP